ncbi:hypothetical protein M0L63_RS17665 [Providencia rettgeri]|nr:hypothetical protein [Providencia rettgeri]ELL9155999.1 hypothetical protein [Providencia rettgeri]
MFMNRIYVKKKLKCFNLLFFIITIFSLFPIKFANAGAYVMPIRTYIDGQGRTHAVQKIIAWDEDQTTQNPCYGTLVCYIGPDVRYSRHPPGLYGSCIEAKSCIEISKYKTRLEVANAYKARFGVPYQTDYPLQSSDATCVGLFYITHTPVLPPSAGATDGVQWPGSTCGKLPPANQYCNIYLPTFVDHGSIKNTDLDGKIETVTGTINCTQSSSLKVYARSVTGERYVYMNNNKSFFSRPLINDNDGWDGVSIPVTGGNISKTFRFSSELYSMGVVRPGQYTGNAIVIISFE